MSEAHDADIRQLATKYSPEQIAAMSRRQRETALAEIVYASHQVGEQVPRAVFRRGDAPVLIVEQGHDGHQHGPWTGSGGVTVS